MTKTCRRDDEHCDIQRNIYLFESLECKWRDCFLLFYTFGGLIIEVTKELCWEHLVLIMVRVCIKLWTFIWWKIL